MSKRSFNDEVERVHRELFASSLPLTPVEGSIMADEIMAASMIRDRARVMGIDEVGNADLATINLALRVVLRRYKASRKQRRGPGEEPPDEEKK
jgi:hypothetical protein